MKLPEIEWPLSLYELRSALPRAYWVPRHSVLADPERLRLRLEAPDLDPRSTVVLSRPPVPVVSTQPGPAQVRYEAVDPHTVVIRATTPPGFLVVLDGHHPDWKAEDRSGPVPLQLAFGRYQAIPTRGGPTVVTLRYQPAWRAPALLLFALGGLAVLVLALRR